MPTKAKGGQTGSKRDAGGSGQKPNGLQQPLQPSKELAAVVGPGPLPGGEVVRKVWEYIKQHELQNPANRREILADSQAGAGVRQEEGDHVRDEQAFGPAPEVGQNSMKP